MGTKHELIDRLANHDGLQARAFSIALKKIAGEKARKPLASSRWAYYVRVQESEDVNEALQPD